MTLYNTEDENIIKVIKTYKDLIAFIDYFENTKQEFITNNNIKWSGSYYKFQGDKFSYSYHKKVAKVFYNIIDNEAYKHFMDLYNIYNSLLIIDFNKNLRYRKDLYMGPTFNKEPDSILRGNELYEFKYLLKKYLHYLLNNKEIQKIE